MNFNSWKLLNNFDTDMFVNFYLVIILFNFCDADSFRREFFVFADAIGVMIMAPWKLVD